MSLLKLSFDMVPSIPLVVGLLIMGAVALKCCWDIYVLLPKTRWGRQDKK